MTRSIMLVHTAPLALALLLCCPAVAVAQTAPAPATTQPDPADTVRLTDEQRLAILDNATVESAQAARGEMVGADRRIHGEVGVMVGSHGTHSVYGVAEVPLGDNATATVAFESSRYGYRR